MMKNTYSKPSQSRSNGGRSDNGRSDNRRQENLKDNNRNGTRVNPREQYQKYMNMGREASSAGNHVQAEEYYQHAEHYYRVMNERNNYMPTSTPSDHPPRQRPAPLEVRDTETPLIIPVDELKPASVNVPSETQVPSTQEQSPATETKPRRRRTVSANSEEKPV